MIEQAMVFALGFCVAGLAALLFVHAVSSRAFRMARQHLETRMPLSIEEIVAQRDLLRADFAAHQRLLEQKIETLQAGRAGDMSELGRRSAEVAALTSELGIVKLSRQAIEVDLAVTTRALNETAAESAVREKTVHDALAAAADYQARHAQLADQHEDLKADHDEKVQSLAALRSDLSETTERAERTERDLMQHRLDLSIARQKSEALALHLSSQDDVARAASAVSLSTIEALRAENMALRASSLTDDAKMLRGAIVAIGEEVVRMADHLQQTDDAAPRGNAEPQSRSAAALL